uniref:Uncharacterized protein n=1 Tax=Setaria italica TaxID=4555 RepID=K3ZB81_SETIT
MAMKPATSCYPFSLGFFFSLLTLGSLTPDQQESITARDQQITANQIPWFMGVCHETNGCNIHEPSTLPTVTATRTLYLASFSLTRSQLC